MINKYFIQISIITLLFTLMACSSDSKVRKDEVNYWDKKKGDCDAVLSAPHAYPVEKLAYCTKMWENYRNVQDIPLKMRSMYAIAFSTVSHKSPIAYDRAVADAALSRLCIPRHPMVNGQIKENLPEELTCSSVSGTTIAGSEIAPSNPYSRLKNSVNVQTASDKQQAAAASANKKGLAEYKKKSYGRAVESYKNALEQDPFFVPAKYNLAATYAKMGDDNAALNQLEELYSWNDPEAEQHLIKARSDADFTALHDNRKFKLLTGYVRLILANGAGDLGLEHISRLKNELESRRYNITEMRNMTQPQLIPQIWYKEGFDIYAEKIKLLIGTPKVSLEKINYETIDDIIVVWGQPEAAQLSGPGQSAPVVQGSRAKGSDNKLDEMTDAVQKTQQSIDKAANTGKSLKPPI